MPTLLPHAPPTWSFEAAFRHMAGAGALLGLDGRWMEVNDAACRLLGRTRARLVGRPAAAGCDLEDAVDLVQHVDAVARGEAPAFAQDLRVPRLDGTQSWLRIEASAIPGADGTPAFMAVGLADTTEQRAARIARDTFFDLCADPLAIATRDGYIVRVNAAWTAALGWTSADMRERPYIEFIHPGDRDRSRAEALRARAEGNVNRFRNRYRTKAGGWRWLEWQTRHGEDGRIYCAARDVTEQQQALIIFEAEMERRHAALDDAEKRLIAHVNNTPIAVIEFDRDFRVRRWSERAQHVFGWSEEEVIGDRPDQFRFIHEDDADAVAITAQGLITGDAPRSSMRNRNYTKDGGIVHCEWFNSAVFDRDGRLVSILSFAQDITARVHAEAEIAEREAQFRATFEQAPVGIAHVGLDGRWLRVNDTLCRFLGYDTATLLATGFQDITHPDDLDADLSQVQAVLDGRIDRYEMRKRYVHRDGSLLWAQLTVSLRRDADGAPVHFISIVEDIAPQIAAEAAVHEARDELELRVVERTTELASANRTLAVEVEQRREMETALRESELRTRTILENSHDAFIAADESGRIVDWNRSAEVIFGWRRSEVIGRSLGEVIVPAPMRQAHESGMARYLATGEERVLDQRLQLPAKHRSGHEFMVEMTITKVRLGKRQLFTAFLHDISERLKAERQLRESEARLRAITDNAPALIAYIDRDLRYRFNNSTYLDWFGRDPATLNGALVREVIGDDAFNHARPYMERALSGEQVVFDTHFVLADGRIRYVHATYVPDLDEDRRVVGFHLMAGDVTAHVQLAQVLEQRAHSDALTGLPNRAGWSLALDAALARDADLAVMFIDLDDFKQVNDAHGHDAGDVVLREVATRLRRCVRGSDVVARLAGDEFVVLLEGHGDMAAAAERVAQTIRDALRPAFDLDGVQLPMSGSIGVAVQAAGGGDGEQLMRRADDAMYAAKRARRPIEA